MQEPKKFHVAGVQGEQVYLVVDASFKQVLSVCESAGEAFDKIERLQKINFDFETIYKGYPRKIGKKRGIKWLKNHIKSEKKYANLAKALQNYTNHVESESIEEKYIMHFSTWVKRYEDWVDIQEERQPSVNSSRSVEEIFSGKSLELF